MINHAIGLLFTPKGSWTKIRANADGVGGLIYTLVLAVLPCVAWYYGTTQIGWSIGNGEMTRLTEASAMPIIVLFYLAMVSTIVIIGYFTHWMSSEYGAASSLLKGIAIASYASTPMFFAGLVGFYPSLWVDMLVGVAAVGWALYLLYVGIPIVMEIPEERGFLFASAIVAVCLVQLVVIIVASVILWDLGVAPEYVN